MQIIEYSTTDNKKHWLQKLRECEWGAGRFLCDILENQTIYNLLGENTRVLMLVDGEQLVSFCTLAEKDDIQPTALTPWIGFVYTYPSYRGRRASGELLRFAESLARSDGQSAVYISTNHIGLYEKYGYSFFQIMKDMNGEDSRVYIKRL